MDANSQFEASVPVTSPKQGSGQPTGMTSRVAIFSIVGLWLLIVIGGSSIVWQYAMQPGEEQQATKIWPDTLVHLRSPNGFTLVMVAHPKCPCTQATVYELAKIMRLAPPQMRAVVFMIRPVGTSAGFERTALWDAVAEIPGVEVQTDPEGRAARLFGLSVSGTTSVYDREAKLCFSGGITSARGHAGDNAGADAVLAIVSGQDTSLRTTPVYGCSLFAPSDSCPTDLKPEVSACCQ
jgi:hypothetical protein